MLSGLVVAGRERVWLTRECGGGSGEVMDLNGGERVESRSAAGLKRGVD